MFVVVYEFEVTPGSEDLFRQAWLDVTKAIYRYCGSYGSRLHRSDEPQRFIGYAQWPSKAQWQKNYIATDAKEVQAREKMRACLIQSSVLYQLEVMDDYLQCELSNEFASSLTP
ncbi:antibiotic biosynthesis monooxygenase [Vibrio sp. SM6]|uniref:Antibiotic biosynthesis monooxygenase n=1 Tax=Vibrio agarilyticus TaxID=2726741 RepID=A0A7X8YFL4_9VIBR|nr:antibiotic biosynthesis monooxygenase [Vibrio agarilyticus]NLS11635.1 antibiotic biosynthesis monooxygenase [Vibrio agarilyticus]